MYIPTWLIVIAIGIGIYFYFRSKKRSEVSDGEPTTVQEMWERAEYNMARVLEKSPNLEEYLQDERDMVRAMERDAIRLRERYKHNPEKQKEVARDWMDYSNAIAEIKFAREMLDVDWEDDAYDRHDERTKESYLVVQEVAKRVESELGEESSSKIVHDRLRKQAEAINEIGEKKSKKKKKEKDVGEMFGDALNKMADKEMEKLTPEQRAEAEKFGEEFSEEFKKLSPSDQEKAWNSFADALREQKSKEWHDEWDKKLKDMGAEEGLGEKKRK